MQLLVPWFLVRIFLAVLFNNANAKNAQVPKLKDDIGWIFDTNVCIVISKQLMNVCAMRSKIGWSNITKEAEQKTGNLQMVTATIIPTVYIRVQRGDREDYPFPWDP